MSGFLKKLFGWTGLYSNTQPLPTKKRALTNKKRPKPIKVPWHKRPEAWALILASDKSYRYLKQRPFSDKRKGYLIGSSSRCDIRISDPRIQPRHCLIYAENYTEINNECSIRVYLKDLSDPQCPTLISIENQIVDKNEKEPIQLFTNNYIKLFCSKNSREENAVILSFIIMFSPNMAAKSFRDEFQIVSEIGKGAYSNVKKVIRKGEAGKGCYLAVKQIHKKKFKSSPKALQRFAQEVNILMSLEYHPGILGIINVYDEKDNIYIVMDYIPEGDLKSLLRDFGALNEKDMKVIFKQLLFGIKFLHNIGIVHRDLKPENIMVANRSRLEVKICDFGLATLHRELNLLTSACGTEYYAAPEIIKYLDSRGPSTISYGKECDLWSLGNILYVCLSETWPFYRSDRISYSERRNALLGRFEFDHPIWETISQEAKGLIKCLLTVDTTKRISAQNALLHPWFRNKQEVP